MALATRRRKPSTQHKKRLAQHHRHNPSYLRTYWPYLPILIILGGGAIINRRWSESLVGNSSSTAGLARIQVLSNSNVGWLAPGILLISIFALAIFIARHTLAFHRVVIKGESFINNHPLLDIAVVLVFTAGFILTNSTSRLG